MTRKGITSRQICQLQKLLGDVFPEFGFTKEEAQCVIRQGGVFQAEVRNILRGLATVHFTRLLTDAEAIQWLVRKNEGGGKPEADAHWLVTNMRADATRRGIPPETKLHGEFIAGKTFKHDIPRMGPCWEDFMYLQQGNFPDPPTTHCMVSWSGAPFLDSVDKNVAEQLEHLAAWKTHLELPDWFTPSFGSTVHLGGMALAHFKETCTAPFADLIARTDTCDEDGRRLGLRWFGDSLHCGRWGWDDSRRPLIAVFAMGVTEALGSSGT